MQVATELLRNLSSVEKVAKHLGVTAETVKNYLGYEAVPEPIKEMVEEGRFGASTALLICRKIADEEQAIGIAEKIKETPRSQDRRKIIDVARENPEKTPEEILKIVKKQKFKRITIDLSEGVADALARACDEYKSDAKDITKEALEDWLKKKGFFE